MYVNTIFIDVFKNKITSEAQSCFIYELGDTLFGLRLRSLGAW